MIDSHCHLADAVFEDDLEAVVARARDAGVTQVMTILAAGDAGEEARAERLAALWSDVRFAAGVHPHQAHQCATPGRAAELVRAAIARNPRVCAIGEIGLDYHYDFSPRVVQRAVFAEQVIVARELRRPIVIHTREATDETFEILQAEGGRDVQGIFHCFTGDPAMARRALDIGFYLSFAGIVTFPKAQTVRDAAALVPDDRLLTETDSPYLAPVPYRGKRNEPAYVERVVSALAELRGTTPGALNAAIGANFQRLTRHPQAQSR
jgi:TatD DNase family protein